MPNPQQSHSSERSPLLRSALSDNTTTKSTFLNPPTDSSSTRPSWPRLPHFNTTQHRFRHVPFYGCLMILTNEAEFFFKQAATMRAIEALYCIEYYNVHDPSLALLGRKIPERLCKADEIEINVASMWSTVMFIRMACAVAVALPLGRWADEGRKRVIALHKTGVLLSAGWPLIVYITYPILPIWSIKLGSFASLIGGNFDLALAVLFASYTDVIPDPVQRASLFVLTTAMQYISQAFCPPIGGLMMNLDGKGGTPWAAMLLGVLMGFFSFFIAVFLFPETLEKDQKVMFAGLGSYEEEEEEEEAEEEGEGYGERKSRLSNRFKGVKTTVKVWGAGIVDSLEGLGVVNTTSLVISMILVQIGTKSIDWFALVQWPVIKLNWTFSQASSVPSFQALVTITLFFLFLPLLTRHLPPLSIMAISLLFLTLGATLLGLSSTPAFFLTSMAIYTLGAGYSVTSQSFIASRIAKGNLAKVLSALSVASTGGKVLASAAWPRLLTLGLDLGKEGSSLWKGLPMFVFAAGFFVASTGVSVVAVRGRRASGMEY